MFLIFQSILTFAQDTDHYEAIIIEGESWKYLVPDGEPDPTWKNPGFDDSTWDIGNSGFGYEDGDDNTVIQTTLSLYIRKQFSILQKSAIEELALYMDYDDAFVAYLNGTEIARSNISGEFPAWDQPSDGWHEALLYQGLTPEKFSLDQEQISSLLNEDENVLAIQIHNQSLTSSDFSAIPFLIAGINNSSFTYKTLPLWFEALQDLMSSDLPLVVINTNGQPIFDDPKVFASFGIVYNGPGLENHLSGPFNEYNGFCGIEIRGESSQSFPKLSYGIEMWDESGNDMDTSFLNFPAEEDFVLHGPYSDKSLMNNVLAMKLANDMGQYASRTRFIELVLNDEYKGVYVLMERIKRDDERVDISKLDPEDISGDQLTGGYIFRIDKGFDEGWFSKYNAYQSDFQINFQYFYPDQDDIQPQQKVYIKSYVDDFEDAVASPTQRNAKNKHYLEYIDLRSFVDNFILNELSKNVDAYRLSTYFHKDRDSKGGKVVAGPVWDYNLAFGNGDYCGGDDTSGWEYYQCVGNSPFWWDTMLEHEDFKNALRCRWEELRQTTLNTNTINDYLDSLTNVLLESRERNFQRWPVMGIYLWPNSWFYASATSHDQIMTYMKDWIEERSIWLDNNIPGVSQDCDKYKPPYEGLLTITGLDRIDRFGSISIYPNPVIDYLHIESDYIIRGIRITTMTGQEIYADSPGMRQWDIDIKGKLPSGVYAIQVMTDLGYKTRILRIE